MSHPVSLLIHTQQPLLGRLIAESLAHRQYSARVEPDLEALRRSDEQNPASALLIEGTDAAHAWLSERPPEVRCRCLVLGEGDLDRFADLGCRLVSPADSSWGGKTCRRR